MASTNGSQDTISDEASSTDELADPGPFTDSHLRQQQQQEVTDTSPEDRGVSYYDQGVNNPPDAGPQGRPQFLDLDVPGSPAYVAGAEFWRQLDGVAQVEWMTGRPPTVDMMTELDRAYVAYMNLAYVGARYDQLEWYIGKAREQIIMLHEIEERERAAECRVR